MDINYWAVVVCGIVAMVLGFIWYGPLFGNKWMKIMHISDEEHERRGEMQKSAGPLYVVQFILALLQAYVLAFFMQTEIMAISIAVAIWLFLGFVMPTTAAGAMWNTDSSKIKWGKFLIQGGYQLLLMIIFAIILTSWR